MVSSHRSRSSEPSYSSPRGHPLPRLPRLRIVPFLGLVVIHRLGALGTAWSMWSMNDFHRKSTIRGEPDSWVHGSARKCLLIMRKIIIPPPDSGDPPDGPPYFAKKHFPLTIGTHQLHLRTQGSASGQKKTIRPPDCWDPAATSSHARKCLTVQTHPVEAYVALSFWSRTCTYILVDVEARTCRSRGAHMS